MRRLITLLIFLPVLTLPARAAEITSFSLKNGMDVVVLEDHRAPVVSHMVWYRVGAADEPAGKSGIAHFLEHLLFKGTDDMDAGEFSATVARNGGSDNAFTSWDYTAYFQRIAADRLDLMMRMEADRMRDLQMTEDDVRTERDVVLEERGQRVDSDPGSLFSEQMRAAQYLNHPYSIPIIGWRHEMEQLSRDDAFSFYQRYYAPNNAILIVAGDVYPDDVRRLAVKHYGPLLPTPDLPDRMRPQEPPQLSERRLSYSDPRVAQPYITRSYLAPERDSGDQAEAAKLEMLAALLGGSGATSVLGQKLQFGSKQAIYTTAFYGGTSLDDTTFGLVMVPTPDVSLADAEAALDQAIAEFMDEGVDSEQFARIKMQLRASRIYGEDNIESLARRYGAALTSGLTIADIEAWPDILQSVSEQDVMDAAKAIFDRSKAVTGWVMPPKVKDAAQ
ncbi:MAG: insulinase family protein [Marinosulfonomonas sp.]|nr:insulinase family protein [Marinosulfonomonas sp.]